MPRPTRKPPQRRRPRLRAITVIARSVTGPSDTPIEPERRDAYTAALEFQRLTAALAPGGAERALVEQLGAASAAILAHLAAGADRLSPDGRARQCAIALCSATECRTIMNVLRSRGAVPAERAARARSLIVRIVRMLARLGQRLRPSLAPRWGGVGRGPGHGH